MMFGETASARRPARKAIDRTGTPVLAVSGLTRHGAFEDVSLEVYRGEILGIAGLLGAGRTELMRAIFGADPADAGTVALDGGRVAAVTPKAMKRAGLGYTPENRKEVGLVQILSTHDNLCMASLGRIAPGGLITRGREQGAVTRQITKMKTAVSTISASIADISEKPAGECAP